MNNVAFGCNKGFMDAVKLLQKRVEPEALGELQVQAKINLKPDDEFKKQIKLVLEDEKTKPVIKKAIKMSLTNAGFNLFA